MHPSIYLIHHPHPIPSRPSSLYIWSELQSNISLYRSTRSWVRRCGLISHDLRLIWQQEHSRSYTTLFLYFQTNNQSSHEITLTPMRQPCNCCIYKYAQSDYKFCKADLFVYSSLFLLHYLVPNFDGGFRYFLQPIFLWIGFKIKWSKQHNNILSVLVPSDWFELDY